MTYRAALVSAAAVLALAVPASASRLTSWYGAVEGGANWVEDFELEQYVTPLGPPATSSTLHEDMGWAALGAIGYSFDNNWRFEVEGGYRQNGFDTLTPAAGVAAPATGDLAEYTLIANALYDFTSPGGVTLSIGGGVGAEYARLTSASLAPVFRGGDTSLAFQAIAGLSVPVSSWLDLTMNYRFLYVPSLNLEDDSTVTPSVAHVDIKDVKKHTVSVGFRFGSRGDSAPAPQVMAPPPPPPPPQIARQYIVFFGYKKCSITANADEVLSEAANAARRLGIVSVLISGHTDSVGSASYNQGLSQCRANAAKTNLVSKGISANAITANGHGENQLLVQTGDGMKEPQNRRATVDLN